MDVATWTTISRLLDDALDLPPESRSAWLDALSAEYDAVKPRLQELLTNASSMDRASFLATLPKFAADEGGGGPEAVEPRDGALLGPYRLVRLLASGGQGSVWLAERADGLLHRPVAVKLPHGLAFRPGLAERMARERDILATLAHPHIARLYDAGVTAEGEPYLALEYVEGVPIDQHASERRLDAAARVRLFQQVVAAVAFAHGRLVIHRDLKPSNILVTAQGEVRLLDFGIAKLLEHDAVDSTLTREAGRAMTLAYASPEQVGQQPLGVASDVYSLGVVLYELLTGVRPYVLARESAAALEEAVLTQEARRASDAVSGPARRTLVGDLDTILAKALRKDPAARYATAEAFGDDLARWLDGRPVLAQPDSRTYRLRKFVLRHRVGVAAATVSLVAVLAGAGVAAWQAHVARTERDEARRQQARAQASNNFLQSLLQQAPPDAPLTATALLERGVAQLDRASNLDPGVLAYLRYSISTHFLRFNQTAREVDLLDKSADGARAIADHELLAAARCGAAWSLAQQDLAGALTRIDEGERALATASAPTYKTRATCARARARVLHTQGRTDEAMTFLERQVQALEPPPAAEWAALSLAKAQLSDLYKGRERFVDELRLTEDGLAEIRRRGETGSLNEFIGMVNLAGVLARLGEARAAQASYDELLVRVERGDFAVPPLGVRSNVSVNLLRLADPERALRLVELERADAGKAGARYQLSLIDLVAGRALTALGRVAEAREALERADAALATNRAGNARVLREVALARIELQARSGAVREASMAVRTVLDELGYPAASAAPGLGRVLRLSARLHLQAGDPARALEDATIALAEARRVAREARQSIDVGEAALWRASALAAAGRPAEAAADAELALAALTSGGGPTHPMAVEARTLTERIREAGPVAFASPDPRLSVK